MNVQMLLQPRQWQTSRGIRSEVAQVPPFDELAKGRYSGMLLQGSEGCDAELAPVLKLHDFGFRTFLSGNSSRNLVNQRFQNDLHLFGFVDLLSLGFSFPGQPPSVVHHKKRKGPSASLSLAALAKAFAGDIGPPRIVPVNRQFVRDGPGFRFFSIVDLEFNRAVAPLRADTLESAPASSVARLLNPQFQAVCKKTEGVEQRALAHPVLSDDHGHRSQGTHILRVPQLSERQILQHAVVRDPDSLDFRHGVDSSRRLRTRSSTAARGPVGPRRRPRSGEEVVPVQGLEPRT